MNNFEDKAWRKLERKERKFEREQRFLKKRTEEYEVLEEVFDRSTLLALYKLFNDGILDKLHGTVSSGKEARIYAGETPTGEIVAVKIYLIATSDFRRSRIKYMMGDSRFSVHTRDLRKIINLWASKEYKNLKKAHEAGVSVPKPIYWIKNIVIMEFIGENHEPALTLKDLSSIDERIYKQVILEARKLYLLAGLVHTDLSEYNIFYHGGRIILFDFAQAVLRTHPMAESFLIRDLSNINLFFAKRGVEVLDLENLIDYVKGKR
mgnify:CR=1 FL=1